MTPVSQIKQAGDIFSVGALFAALAQILPVIASAITIVWFGFRIYESRLNARKLKAEIAKLEDGNESVRGNRKAD